MGTAVEQGTSLLIRKKKKRRRKKSVEQNLQESSSSTFLQTVDLDEPLVLPQVLLGESINFPSENL